MTAAYNILLALAWALLTGSFTLASVTAGFVIGFAVLHLVRGATGDRYSEKVLKVVSLAGVTARELLQANIRLAVDALTPRHRAKPAVVAVPLEAETDTEIFVLSVLITLTPDTLALHVSHDRRVLYVYGVYVEDVDAFCRRLKQTFERPLLEVTR